MIESSLLWCIESSQSRPSYVFGTMHVRDDIAYTHTTKAINALIKCQEFKTEIDLNAAKSQITAKDYFFNDGATLKDHLRPVDYAKARAIIAKAFDIELDTLSRLLPILIVNKIMENELGDENPLPLDSYLWQEAENYKLTTGGLETIAEQIATLRGLDVGEQLRMFKRLCRNITKFRKSTAKLTELYAVQDIQELYVRTAKSLGSSRKPLLYLRNQKMADRIAGNMTVSCFYAVGAAHLAGQKGVLNLLKQKGLQIRAVN